MLDPQARALIDLMVERQVPPTHTLSVADARRVYLERRGFTQPEPPAVGEVRELQAQGPLGAIPLRLYKPAGAASGAVAGAVSEGASGALPVLVYFHGGGWVLGSLDSTDSVARFLARYSGVSVLSVEYRLAPEHPYPAAPDDALAAFRFAVAMAPRWGHDPARIAVGGDSAGGNLATVLCQDLLRAGEPLPAFQLLFFPAVDLSRKRPSYAEFADGYFLTEAQMDWYTAHYLSGGGSATDPRVSPLLATDLAGLPPAYIAVAGFDVLRDEGEEYARALAAAGVDVALRRHDGLVHAFVNATGLFAAGKEATLEAAGALRLGVGAGLARR